MRTLLRCLLFFVLCFVIGIVNVSARPSRASAGDTKLADRQSAASFDPTPAPLSMLLVGGGLLVFGGILRRWLRT
jgi:hypothetical protein